MVGVNGSGKTTTTAKLAKKYTDAGKKVMIAAGDTYRAAAIEQPVWGNRLNIPVIAGKKAAILLRWHLMRFKQRLPVTWIF